MDIVLVWKHIENVKVLGMVNITVLAAGSIYLGDMFGADNRN